MRFKLLGSSSQGNSGVLECGPTRILIDAGFSGRELCRRLKQNGVGIETISAVLITHEHHDHACGLKGLTRYKHLKFFANEYTYLSLRDRMGAALPEPNRWQCFENERSFQLGGLNVKPFAIPHDASDPVGFAIHSKRTGKLLCWATDMGHMPEALAPRLAKADILVLESNYEDSLLEASKRTYSLKQRIRSRHGHLSNADAVAYLKHAVAETDTALKPNWKHVLLCHLSRECNNPAMLEAAVLSIGTTPWHTNVVHPTSEGTDWIEGV